MNILSMIFKLKYLVLLAILISSCEKNTHTHYEFNPNNLKETAISLNEIADDISYIELDNIYQISLIYNFYFTESTIYLSAKDIGVVILNKDGSLLKKIGSIGRGPGEYYRHTKFAVDYKSGNIYIPDSDNIIKVYSENGEFLRSISFKEYEGNIDLVKIFNSKLFLFNYPQFGDAKYDWIVLDSLGRFIKAKDRALPIFRSNWGGESGTYFLDSDLFYWNSFNDTVYQITPDLNYKVSLKIGQGDHRLPRAPFDPQIDLAHYLLLQSIFETKKYWVIQFLFNEKNSLAIIEKKGRKSFMKSWDPKGHGGIINNLDGGPEFLPAYYYAENDREYMVGYIEPYLLKAYAVSAEFKNSRPLFPGKKEELEKLANSLKETDNPVLVRVRLKK